MKTTYFYKLTWIGLLMIIIYSCIYLSFHFYVPDLADITVTTVPDVKYGVEHVTLTADKPDDLCYLLIYEEDEDENWIYYAPRSYNDSSQLIRNHFLPEDKSKYILLEGTSTKSSFAFSLKPKYNLTALANKEHVFHVIYIVPYKLTFFPTFYYTQHSVFFIDPIL